MYQGTLKRSGPSCRDHPHITPQFLGLRLALVLLPDATLPRSLYALICPVLHLTWVDLKQLAAYLFGLD